MTRAKAVIFLCAAVVGAGCVGYRNYYDRDADQYKLIRLTDVLRKHAAARSQKRALYTLHVASYVGGELVEPISEEWPELDALARRTVEDTQLFRSENIGNDVERPDYHFIFDVKIETTCEAGLFSGLILPFYRARETTVKLQVLDEKGQPFSNYVASAETFQVRHILLLPLAPFYWPGWADSRARRNPFEALAVKLIAERKEFL